MSIADCVLTIEQNNKGGWTVYLQEPNKQKIGLSCSTIDPNDAKAQAIKLLRRLVDGVKHLNILDKTEVHVKSVV